MKKLMFIVLAAISACTTKPDKTVSDNADSVSLAGESSREPATQILCFQRFEGTSNQDTTRLRLEITGNQVSGQLAHYPFEKDRRTGSIAAIRDGDIIKGQWYFMQEGINDTLDVEFQLRDGRVFQKSYTVDSATGKQVITGTSIFDMEFEQSDCLDVGR